jgi:hypothetical protein
MRKITQMLLVGLGFGLLTVALGFLTSRPAPAQVPPPFLSSVPVTVTNAATKPVPTSAQGTTTIAGTVAITGTPNMNATIINTPTVNANITSPLTLAPGSTISVANSLSGGNPVPLFVRDVNSPGLHPFAVNSTCGQQYSCTGPLGVSPANVTSSDQTIVIETVGARCTGFNYISGQKTISRTSFNLSFYLGGQPFTISFPAAVESDGLPFPVWSAAILDQTKIYADAQNVNMYLGPTDPVSGVCTVSLTGYYIVQ